MILHTVFPFNSLFINLERINGPSQWITIILILWSCPTRPPYPIFKLLTKSNQQLENILQLEIWLMCSVQYLSQQLLPLQRETIHLYLAPRGYLHSSAVTPNLSRQDLNHIQFFPGAQAWYRTGDILLLQGNSFDTLIQDIKIQRNSQLRE